MTGRDFLAQAAGAMAANHLREISEHVDRWNDLAALKARVAELESEALVHGRRNLNAPRNTGVPGQ